MLGAQYLADSYGITLRAPDGTPIKSAIIDYIQIGNLNSIPANMQALNNGTSIIDSIIKAAYVGYQLGWELFTLLFGFYIFNVIYLFGVPAIFVVPITGMYIILLIITIISKIRGV